MNDFRVRRAVCRAVAAGMLVLSVAAPSAQADPPSQVIQTPGALTDIRIGAELSCQVHSAGDVTNQFFPPDAALGDCGTFLAAGGTMFGPDFANHDRSSFPVNPGVYTPYTSVTQSAVTGAGTADSPYTLVTRVAAGSTGLSITETDSYTVPNENYRTDIVVANTGQSATTATLYRGFDCYLQGSDVGYGVITAAGAPACAQTPNNSPSDQVEELSPQTPGFRYLEAEFLRVWETLLAQTGLPNTCGCTIREDNGAAISWDINVPAGGSVTYSMINNFSASGQVIGAPAAATEPPKRVSNSDAILTGVVNPAGEAVTDCHFEYGKTTAYGSTVPCAETVGAGTAPVAVSAKVAALNPGETYHYLLSVTTAGGTTTGADQTLTTDRGPDAPTLGKTVNVVPVSGTVYGKPPRGRALTAVTAVRPFFGITKGAGFVPIEEARQISLGWRLDARRGAVQMMVADSKPGITRSVRLSGAVFDLDQAASGLRKGLTTFTLKLGAFPGAPSSKGCPTGLRAGKSTNARIAKKVPRSVLQTLRAKSNKGKFSTRGEHSAGTVRGTSWTTIERCDGTLTKVKRGTVDVRDFERRKTVAVKAGQQYLAKAIDARRG